MNLKSLEREDNQRLYNTEEFAGEIYSMKLAEFIPFLDAEGVNSWTEQERDASPHGTRIHILAAAYGEMREGDKFELDGQMYAVIFFSLEDGEYFVILGEEIIDE